MIRHSTVWSNDGCTDKMVCVRACVHTHVLHLHEPLHLCVCDNIQRKSLWDGPWCWQALYLSFQLWSCGLSFWLNSAGHCQTELVGPEGDLAVVDPGSPRNTLNWGEKKGERQLLLLKYCCDVWAFVWRNSFMFWRNDVPHQYPWVTAQPIEVSFCILPSSSWDPPLLWELKRDSKQWCGGGPDKRQIHFGKGCGWYDRGRLSALGPGWARKPWVRIGGRHLVTGRWYDMSVGKGEGKEVTSGWKTWKHLVEEKAKLTILSLEQNEVMPRGSTLVP